MNDFNFFLLSSSTTSTTYHLRLYYNSHLNVIRSLVFYPSFLEKFFTPPIVWDISNPLPFLFKIIFGKIIGHLLSSSSTQNKHFERVNIQHTLSTKWWPTGHYVYEKNFFEVKFPHCFLIKDFRDFEKRSEEGRTNFESKFRKF